RKARVLAITGSNTGGKTVSLKTIGLFSLIFQAGLPIPADPGSRLPFYDNILADIGDEQSLEQSLSTFSGHLKNISEILEASKKGKSLILMDELGSGTDPVEGGALGCSIIEQLAERDCMTFLTTHLGMIKVFVHERRGMINASVRFNQKTLEPEYILDVGLPGASHALSIAARLNIPEDVIKRAHSFLSEDELKLEDVLERLDSKQRSLSEDAEEARIAREKAVSEREQLKNELKELKNKRREILHDAQREAEAIVENARKDMERTLSKLKKDEKPADVKEMRKSIEGKRDNLRKVLAQTTAKPAKVLSVETLSVGVRVWIPRLKDHGTISTLSNDKKSAEVEIGGMTFSMKTKEFSKEMSAAPKPTKRKSSGQVRYAAPRVSLEISLIGKRVEPALKELQDYLDNAVQAGLEQVRIVHGRGTGMLRRSIHDFLGDCSQVRSFDCPDEGDDSSGDNVTDVKL
ncbi:MAG: Smr/MutS family protein, partial [Lentisphaeraceae bacterium]|nr:Smr/MutS family protein [Lentisphaeraceae bacterium]